MRVLSGMRPTGRLHLGNYMGALYNWVKLQNERNDDGSQKYECYFFIADYHALTTDYADPSKLQENIYEVALDFLSAGLDPSLCTIFVQSHVPAHFALNDLLGMITPLSWLERVPSYKDQQQQLRDKDLNTIGFLGYPLLQSADILLYQPKYVPVGQDQAAHVEITREIARRFNQLYSPKRVAGGSSRTEEPDPERLILPEPEVLLTPSPKLPGLDGRKMSKSYGNTILISDPPVFIKEKMSRMTNGGQRNPQSLPGDPDRCPVGDMHKLFSEPHVIEFTHSGCRSATISCATCKQMGADSIIVQLHGVRERREQLETNPEEVWSILEQGAAHAASRAEHTMSEVRAATGLARTPNRGPVAQVYFAGEAIRTGHDLGEFQIWWNQDSAVRAKNLRDYWLTSIVPSEIRLTQDSDRVYITPKKKRVYVTAAREAGDHTWIFDAKPKSYEILALLCWDEDRRLHDFVVPQILYQGPWTAFKKRFGKDEEMRFRVARMAERYLLQLPDAEPIDITSYQGSYEPVK
jgi:tryptophanyl-tRNA synthetase